VKVVDDGGGKGLVPASYVEFSEESEATSPVSLQSGPRQVSGKYGTSQSHYLDCC
jgi:hypothetical protein